MTLACGAADAGARIVVVGRRMEWLDRTVELVGHRGGEAVAHQCDLDDAHQARDLVAAAGGHFGPVDVLVNNAGIATREDPAIGVSPEAFDRMLATNVRGIYYAILGAGREMPPRGAVVNIASVTGHVPDPELTAYAAGKAAVESLTRSFATTLGPRGIRVNVVSPGYLDTPLNTDRKADPGRAAAVVGRTPLKRWGEPGDVSDAVVYLASDRAKFITGQVLQVAGGFPFV